MLVFFFDVVDQEEGQLPAVVQGLLNIYCDVIY